MTAQEEKCLAFRNLHHGDHSFIVPNPWDVGSAKVLQGLGFKALATTSAGLAYTLGLRDYQVSLQQLLDFSSNLAANTTVPVTVDFENGFAHTPEGVAQNVLRLAETGVAGCSIEDFDSSANAIYDLELSVERVDAAARAVASLRIPFQLTARAENLSRGVEDLDNTIERLKRFEAVGADVLYAPGIRTLQSLRTVTAELSRPFNVLAPFIAGASMAELEAHGARRISLGGALNWHVVGQLIGAATEMLTRGTFTWTEDVADRTRVLKLLAG